MLRMRLLSIGCLLALGALLGGVSPGYAQDGGRPLVVFVLERDLQTASVADTGPDGISKVADIFRRLGAQTRFVRLYERLPDEARVVVLVRPLRQLTGEYVARLWRHLERGNSLLLAIDPPGYPSSARVERAGGALGALLGGDYGASYEDTFLALPWFARDALADIAGSTLSTYADSVPHPIIAPLSAYQLPVQVWGARTTFVEPLGIDSLAFPLVAAPDAFAETNANVFATRGEPAPLEANLESDPLGRLTIGGAGQNTRTGSRIVVLGDSEMLLNGFGLRQTAAGLPLFPGNQILVERLAAWLLKLPVEEWPPLPSGFLWLALDGDPVDWGADLPAAHNEDENPAVNPAYDIRQVRVFRNDSYLYVLVETASPPDGDIGVLLDLNPVNTARGPVTVVAKAGEVAVVGEDGVAVEVPDAQIGIGQALEIRIPLRVARMNEQLTLDRLCLADAASAPDAPQDCTAQPIAVRQVAQRDPASLRLTDGPLVTVSSPNSAIVNLRAGPGTDFAVLTQIGNGTLLAAAGRNEAGDWVKIQNARYEGWMAALVVKANADITALPVVGQP